MVVLALFLDLPMLWIIQVGLLGGAEEEWFDNFPLLWGFHFCFLSICLLLACFNDFPLYPKNKIKKSIHGERLSLK